MRTTLSTSLVLVALAAAGCGSVTTSGDGDGDGDGDGGVNTDPVIDQLMFDSSSPAAPIGVTCSASDADGDELTIAIVASDGTVDDSGDGTATWTPPLAEGDYEVGCQVDDGNGGTAEATVPAPLRVEAGLVARWDFNGTGDDSSGNGHSGSFIGLAAPTFDADRFGNAGGALICGGNNNFQADDEPAFDLGQFTLAAWVSVQASNTDRTIISKPSANGFGNYNLMIRSDSAASFPGQADYSHDDVSGGNSGTIASTDAVPTNQFIHVAVTYDGSRLDTYLDGAGQLSANNVPAPLLNDNPLRVGFGNRGGFVGLVDDVRVFNRALSPDEVKALADAAL